MSATYTETSILEDYIAQRTTLNVWLVGGIKLTGIPRFQNSRVIVIEPLDIPSDGGCLIVFKQACASIGKVCSHQWPRRSVFKRRLPALNEHTNEEDKT